jgi:hypothetical protein
MKIKSYVKVLASICFSTLLFLITGCSAQNQALSNWAANKISVDGEISDWSGIIKKEEGKNYSLGISNDDKFFYLSIATDNRMTMMQMLRNGITIWIRPYGYETDVFGIKYPIAKQTDLAELRGVNRDMMNPANLENLFKSFLEKQNELEIINPEKYPLAALPIANNMGIKAKLGYGNQIFTYELQIPLMVTDDHQFALGALPGEDFGVRIEVDEFKIGGTGGGMGQGGGMRQGGNTMPRAFQLPEAINHSIDIKLGKN